MAPSLLNMILGRPSGEFVRAARARGLKTRVAKTLRPSAYEIAPKAPGSVLESRELFEQAAMRAVIGDAGNLELSFGLVDVLASAVESLGLARSSDVPDPFRRVWVENAAGERKRGVVFTCDGAEVCIFCPPGGDAVADIGSPLNLRYRGCSSSVAYELLLNDAVRLPGALVLHLTRFDGFGAAERKSDRFSVELAARVHFIPPGAGGTAEESGSCTVLDFSSGGLQFLCDRLFEKGDVVALDVPLPEQGQEALAIRGAICWIGNASEAGHPHGIMFQDLTPQASENLERYLRGLRNRRLTQHRRMG